MGGMALKDGSWKGLEGGKVGGKMIEFYFCQSIFLSGVIVHTIYLGTQAGGSL